MASHLIDLAVEFSDPSDRTTRLSASGIYELYARYFADMADQPIALLELGVHRGDSLKTFSRYFPHGTVIGIDHIDRGIDLTGFANAHYEIADQRDGMRLAAICARHAPSGLDIIIDDASHFGSYSLLSYQALFPLLKPGGLYCIEDWATGYWTDWPDGGPFEDAAAVGEAPAPRIRSHDFGMVGFVKHLVDEVASRGIRPSLSAPITRPDRMEFVHVYPEAAIARKAKLRR